jgi:hypothetical protein
VKVARENVSVIAGVRTRQHASGLGAREASEKAKPTKAEARHSHCWVFSRGLRVRPAGVRRCHRER